MKNFNGKAMEMKMNHGLHRLAALTLAILGMGFAANAAAVTATTEPFRLSIKHDGIRQSVGDETLAYSSQWDGGDGATVTIAQDGAALVEGLTGEGERTWIVTRNGTYVLTHTTYTNGVAGKVETATFVVTGKDVPFAEGDVTVSGYEAKYDGAAHGIGVTIADEIAGAVVKYATVATDEFTSTETTLTDVGSMTVWCEIAAPGYITQTNSATITITKRAVTLTSGDASKVYDGSPVLCGDVHIAGNGFVAGEGATFNVTGSQTAAGTSENTFTYTLNDGTLAENYDITTVNGTLTVTKATVGPGGGGSGGDEPGNGEVPQGGESKFDVTAMYDGEGHTIDTNALTAAFGAAMIGEFAVAYAADDGNGGPGVPALPWGTVPVYTNAGEYVVWYRVSNPNYEDFIHAAKVTITNRPVTVTSSDGSWTYDGQAHSNATVTAEGFVDGEGIVAGDFAEIVDVGTAANAFTYAFADGTLAENYGVTCVTGTLTVASAGIDGWTGDAGTKYDTSFTAKDMVGNTNITMATIRKSDGSAANVTKEQLLPGTYNWVWDAAADLPKNWQCDRVTVTGTAVDAGFPAVANGLVAWWPFDGDIKDHSGNQHHLSGSVSYVADRKGNNSSAGKFSGNSFLKQQTNLGVSGALTIGCWINNPTYEIPSDDISSYLDAIGYGNFGQNWCYFPMIVFPVSSTSGRGIGLSVAKNRIDVFAHGKGPLGFSSFNVFLDHAITIGSGWHHVAVTVGKSTDPILYYDGVKVKTGSSKWNGSQVYLNSGSTIGGGYVVINGGNNARNYKGNVDDIVIYNRILSATEIKKLYDSGK